MAVGTYALTSLANLQSSLGISAGIDETILETVPAMDKHLWVLDTAVTLGPLMGLLGTIFGMIEAFNAVATVAADQRSQALAKGISIAINTTGLGLMVAIPLLASQVFIQNLAKKITDEVDLYAVKLENLLAARVRQG